VFLDSAPTCDYILRRMFISVTCLNCGHAGALDERELPQHGLPEDASLVTLTRRLVCQECGSRAVRAFRFDPDAPPLAPR
jgi:DNA-directed RNA polymerase subunit RPC12/RpoP